MRNLRLRVARRAGAEGGHQHNPQSPRGGERRAPGERRPVIRSFIRANHRIRVPTVRCVDAQGNMLGIMPTREAMRLAQQQGLDLVEIAPNADPPVCRIMDFGKFKYEQDIKRKETRKHQQSRVVKEMKFHPNVAEHDYQTKVKHIREFLEKGHKVKLTLTFRGRENAHKELGFELIGRVIADCSSLGVAEMSPHLMGRSLVAMLAPRGGKSGGRPAPSQPAPAATRPLQDAARPAAAASVASAGATEPRGEAAPANAQPVGNPNA